MLEVSPSFVVAIAVCIVIGALGVWLWQSGDAGRGVCVACLCGRNFCFLPTSFQSFAWILGSISASKSMDSGSL